MLDKVGAELFEYRTDARLSQQMLGDILDHNRDWMHKIEAGKNGIMLYDYLVLIHSLRDFVPPDHPGLVLAEYMLCPKKPAKAA